MPDFGDDDEPGPTDDHPTASWEGAILDERYRLDGLIGQGGMGRVYRATQLSIDRQVAVKLLRTEPLSGGEVEQRFLREARVISSFSHPNIVRLIDYGRDTDRQVPYLVMELVRGVSLGRLTSRGRLGLPLTLEIAHQVCGALVQSHKAGIVHRDLKPDNLHLVPVVGDSFRAKVLDFGIALPRQSASRITSTGMICGTAYYIAPEQARGRNLDGRADLYALGIILFQMLTGHLPFQGDSDFQILLMQVQQPPPGLDDFLDISQLPRGVVKLVERLLAKSPDDRPSSARAVRDKIDAIRSAHGVSPPDIDLEDVSPQAFDRWIYPPGAPVSVVQAPTVLDESTPPEVRARLEANQQSSAAAADDSPPPDSDQFEHSGKPAARNAPSNHDQANGPPKTPANEPRDDSEADRGRVSLMFLVGAVAVLVAGLCGIWWWQHPHDDVASTDGNGAVSADARRTDNSADLGSIAQRTVPLVDFTGRCTGLGENAAWFHTVFLYPTVGELLLAGDSQTSWMPIETTGHQANTLRIRPKTPHDDLPASLAVHSMSDKLIFEFDPTPEQPAARTFICRKPANQPYFDTLQPAGTFVDPDDHNRTLHISAAAQRLRLDNTDYVYRILSGTSLTDGQQIALRKADAAAATWSRASITYEQNTGKMVVSRHDASHTFISPSSQSSTNLENVGTHQKPPAANGRSTANQAPAPPVNAPLGRASSDVVAKFRELVRADVARFCAAQKFQNDRIAHHQSLVDQGRYDEAEAYSNDVLGDKTVLQQKFEAAIRGFTNTLRRARADGLSKSQVQTLVQIWQDKCK